MIPDIPDDESLAHHIVSPSAIMSLLLSDNDRQVSSVTDLLWKSIFNKLDITFSPLCHIWCILVYCAIDCDVIPKCKQGEWDLFRVRIYTVSITLIHVLFSKGMHISFATSLIIKFPVYPIWFQDPVMEMYSAKFAFEWVDLWRSSFWSSFMDL